MRPNCFAFLLLLLLGACGQDYNSNSGDTLYRPAIDANACASAAGKRTCDAINVLKDNCYSCHSAWSDYASDQQFIDAGLVVAKNKASSKLITKLLNEGGNMPSSGSAIPESAHQTLLDWVTNM